VIFDTIKRYLVYLGYQVTWVVNITDVDDKLIIQAEKDGTTVKELADREHALKTELVELETNRGQLKDGVEESVHSIRHLAFGPVIIDSTK